MEDLNKMSDAELQALRESAASNAYVPGSIFHRADRELKRRHQKKVEDAIMQNVSVGVTINNNGNLHLGNGDNVAQNKTMNSSSDTSDIPLWLKWLVAILAVVGGIWKICDYYKPALITATSAPTFTVEMLNNSILEFNPNLDVTPTSTPNTLWVTYNGNIASPVALMSYMYITNISDTTQTFSEYSLAINTKECGWVDLIPIPTHDGIKVWLTFQNLSNADEIDLSPDDLSSQLENPIIAGETISGWWLWASPSKCNLDPESAIQYRVAFKTFTGINYSTTSITTSLSSTTEGITRVASFKMLKKGVDISGYNRELFSL